MTKSLEIPQDIIDNVVAAVGDDKRLLKQCSLVSTSFLLPCRKLLFSKISLENDQTCQGIHQFLVQNPVIQSFVGTIILTLQNRQWVNGTSLLGILGLPLCRLEHFSIGCSWGGPSNWNSFSNELKDALSNFIHSSNLKSLSLRTIKVPFTFFLHIVHLTTLELWDAIQLNDFGNDENSSPLTLAVSKGVAPIASHTLPVIDRLVWWLSEEYHSKYYIGSTRLPSSTNFSLI